MVELGFDNKRKSGRGNTKSVRGVKIRGKEEETDMEAVLFVPHTPKSELANLLQQADDSYRSGTSLKRIKMVELGGKSVKDILSRKNPWADEGCMRKDCLPCRSERGGGGDCQKESVVYTITCQECLTRGTSAEYTGETSRTGYTL